MRDCLAVYKYSVDCENSGTSDDLAVFKFSIDCENSETVTVMTLLYICIQLFVKTLKLLHFVNKGIFRRVRSAHGEDILHGNHARIFLYIKYSH